MPLKSEKVYMYMIFEARLIMFTDQWFMMIMYPWFFNYVIGYCDNYIFFTFVSVSSLYLCLSLIKLSFILMS